MTTEAKQLVAFLFQRSGKELLSAQDIYMTLSYELGWMTPGEAKKLITQAVERGLLREDAEGYTPTFAFRDVDIPLGFHIDGLVVDDAPTTPLSDNVVEEVVAALKKKGQGARDARQHIEETARRQHILPEAAALVVAHRQDLDTAPFLPLAWKAVKKA